MSLLSTQGPKGNIRSKVRSGPNTVEIKIVNQDKELNQKSNALISVTFFLHLANPSLTFVMETLTTPE